jgi:hypothetical protein
MRATIGGFIDFIHADEAVRPSNARLPAMTGGAPEPPASRGWKRRHAETRFHQDEFRRRLGRAARPDPRRVQPPRRVAKDDDRGAGDGNPDRLQYLLLGLCREGSHARRAAVEDHRQPGGCALRGPALHARDRRGRRLLRSEPAGAAAGADGQGGGPALRGGELGQRAGARGRADGEDRPRARAGPAGGARARAGGGAFQPSGARLRFGQHRSAAGRATPGSS